LEVKKCSVPQVVHSDGVLQWLLQFCGMAFLKIERKDTGTYLRIAESFRDQEGKTRHRILHSLGKVEVIHLNNFAALVCGFTSWEAEISRPYWRVQFRKRAVLIMDITRYIERHSIIMGWMMYSDESYGKTK